MTINRRQFLQSACAGGLALRLAHPAMAASHSAVIKKTIPSSGEQLNVIGMGTSRTFNDEIDPEQLREVLQIFFDQQGQLIDSSPMYGPAERLLGELLPMVNNKSALFAATKVWTDGREQGIEQMQRSLSLMGVPKMDLMQIHNLRDWELHLPTLRAWKEEGRIRYIGITTSHGRYHAELEAIMRTQQLDFVQLSYNIADRETDNRLLPVALDKGIAILINRPYQRGDLFSQVKDKPLPDWASEIDCQSWGQFFLKFAAAHPAATCVIPATSKPKHIRDNMQANYGRLPDQAMRKEMIAYFDRI
ncbi:MAG: aldo/keto reductase [Gammaproteobacteria bacterium]